MRFVATALTPLPIDSSIPRMLAEISRARAAVLIAPPGTGKTTRLPPALLNAGMLGKEYPNIVMLQPRRVAARAAARRIADEQGWEVGGRVGYHVRFDRKISRDTRLRVVTEGILVRQLLDDPFLEGVGAVILDEFHERSIHTDLAIALLREVRQTVRPDLIVVVMSATLEGEKISQFLDGCPVLRIEAPAYPVRVEYSPGKSVTQVMDRTEGDVLIFLPGAEEIRRIFAELEELQEEELVLLPLHGSLPVEEQDRALAPDPRGRRKVVLATNVAETSLTIPGVKTVIDSGLARVAGYDAGRGLDRLDLKRISQASATQRAGRAGREGPGICIRLWAANENLEPFEKPEICRVDLAGTVLNLHAWGRDDPRGFGWFEAPPENALAGAEKLLEMLGALDGGKITALGKRMAELPLHPRLARLLLGAADAGMAREGAMLAAILSERDMGNTSDVSGESDLLVRLEKPPRTAIRLADDLLRMVRPRNEKRSDADTLLKLILLAYPDRVARRRSGDSRSAVMVGGKGLRMAVESVVHRAEFFVAVDARQDDRSVKSEALVRMASAIEPSWLEEFFPKLISRKQFLEFDEKRGRVMARTAICYLDLTLREQMDAPADLEAAGNVLAKGLSPRAEEWFKNDPAAAKLLARLDFLRRHIPEHPWPSLDAAELLAAACQGKRSVEELGPPAELLRGMLVHPLDRILDKEAPETLTVPTGNRISLQYELGRQPVLAVRLQEIFGWTQTPRLAGGRAPVLMHLLAPNFRPVQITGDLASFWKTAYFEVRKDLRRRYPKHSWPDDPLTAKPQSKGKPRRI